MGIEKAYLSSERSVERLTCQTYSKSILEYFMHFLAESPQEMEKINVEKSQSLSASLRAQIVFLAPIAPYGRYGLVSDVLRWRSGLRKNFCNYVGRG